MKRFIQALLITLVFPSWIALGQEESFKDESFPEENKRKTILGGQLIFGQSYGVDGSAGGVGYLGALTLDFVIPRGSWRLFEIGLELGTGELGYRNDASPRGSVTIPIKTYGLLKVGRGNSLGEDFFSVWRIGVGPIWAGIEERTNGLKKASSDSILGFQGSIEVDVVAPFSNDIDLIGGIVLRRISINIDEVSFGGQTENFNENIQVTFPALRVGLRKAF